MRILITTMKRMICRDGRRFVFFRFLLVSLYGFIGVAGLYGRWDVFCCKIHLLRLDWGKQMD